MMYIVGIVLLIALGITHYALGITLPHFERTDLSEKYKPGLKKAQFGQKVINTQFEPSATTRTERHNAVCSDSTFSLANLCAHIQQKKRTLC